MRKGGGYLRINDRSNHCGGCGRRISQRRILCAECRGDSAEMAKLIGAADEAIADWNALTVWATPRVRTDTDARVRAARAAVIAAAKKQRESTCLNSPTTSSLT
jgi:hypothetical protein